MIAAATIAYCVVSYFQWRRMGEQLAAMQAPLHPAISIAKTTGRQKLQVDADGNVPFDAVLTLKNTGGAPALNFDTSTKTYAFGLRGDIRCRLIEIPSAQKVDLTYPEPLGMEMDYPLYVSMKLKPKMWEWMETEQAAFQIFIYPTYTDPSGERIAPILCRQATKMPYAAGEYGLTACARCPDENAKSQQPSTHTLP